MDFLSHDAVPPQAVDTLLDRCFGPARHRRTAALLRAGSDRLELASFVALDDGELIGSVEVWPLLWRHPRGTRPLALLGPLVSHPARRGERIGARLMDLALAGLDRLALPATLIGDAPYYGRWGFTAEATAQWRLPGPVDRARLLLRTADPDDWRGPALIAAPGPARAEARAAA
jgi:predicted N-acetyltransferase YhbS